MAAARQEETNGAMLSILKKMDAMVSATQQTYEQSLITLGSVETIMKVDVGTELKKQTAILMSIEAKMSKGDEKEGKSAGGEGNMKSFEAAFGSVANTIDKLLKSVEKVDEKKADQLKNFFIKLSESVNTFTENVDEKKTQAASDLITSIGSGVINYALMLTLATPLLLIALPGTILFGLSLRILTKTMGEVEADPKALEALLSIGGSALKFSAAMALISLAAPLVLLGATVFGLSIRLLMKTTGEVDKSTVEGMAIVTGLARGAILYSLSMIVVSILSPIVLVGSILFGLSIRMLMKTTGEVDKSTVEGMSMVMGLARGAILYSLAMIVVSVLSPIVLVGSVLFGLSIRLLLASTGAVDKSTVEGMHAVMGLARGAILYSLAMVVVSVLSPIVLIGSVLFGLSIRMLLKTTGEIEEKQLEGMYAVMGLARGAILYSLAMVVVSVLSPIVLVGSVLFGLSIRMLLKTTGEVDEKRIEGMKAVLVIAKGAILYSLAMVVVSVLSPIVLVGSVLFGLSIRLLLKSTGDIDEKRVAAMNSVLALAKGALLYSLAMVVVSVLSPIVLVGSVLFGLSIRLLLKATGDIDSKKIEAMNAVLALAKGAILYSLAMVVVTVLSPVVILGSVLFGLSIRLLLASTGAVDPKKVAAMNAVLALAKGAILYSLAMVVVSVLSPVVILGSVLFGLSIRLLFVAMGTVDDKRIKQMQSVLTLAKGVLLYSLAMIVVSVLSPIVILGSVLFGLSIRLLFVAMGTVDNKKIQQMKAILTLAKGVLLYSLAMVVVTLLAPIVLIGSVIFGISLFILSKGLAYMGDNKVKKGVRALLMVSLGIFALGIAIWAFSKMVTIADAIFTVLTVAGFAVVFYFVGKQAVPIAKGALAMVAVGIAVIFLSIGLLLFKASNFGMMDALTLGITIAGLGIEMYIAGKFFKEIALGSGAMIIASIAVILLSVGLIIFKASKFELMDALSLGAAIAAVGVAMGIAGAGPIPGFIAAGSAAMIVASVAIIILSVGLMLFKASKFELADSLSLGAAIGAVGVTMGLAGLGAPFIMAGAAAMIIAGVSLIVLSLGLGAFKLTGFKMEDSVSLGAAIGAIGVTMGLAGLGSPLIILGSVAMILASVALLPITGALAVFKTLGWKKEDNESLTGALGSVISGFLGGEMPGGILASIKFAAQAAARAALLFISVPPMILAGVALLAIVPALVQFKKSGFNKTDADNVEFMIGSIVKAFGIVTDTERQKKMGFYVNPIDLMLGIASLSGAGRVLAGLAEGVQAWANLEVNEWEVINPGTAKAQLVIKNRRKLNKTDFDNAAYGMAQVISAIAGPFAMVGRLEKGQASGNPLLDSIFSGGFVSKGIEALKHSGDTIVSLANGVRSFATMEYTQYEVVNAGTPEAKLVPKGVIKIGPMEVALASMNIAMVIGVVAKAFADVGRMEAESSGIFSGGFVSKGVAALAGVGDNLGAIVDSVLKMANREIPTFDLINGGTKDAKLVPGKPKTISDADLTNAATTIMDILKVVATGFYDIGKMESDSSSWWGDGFITKGVKAIGGIGDIVSKVTDSVIKVATGTITPMTAVGEGKDTKLVPGTPIKVTGAMLKAAAKTINDIMMVLGRGMYDFGKFYSENQEPIDSAIGAVPTMSSALMKLAESTLKFGELDKGKVDGAVMNLRVWSDEVRNTFGLFANGDAVSKIPIEKLMTSVNAMPDITRSLDVLAEGTKGYTSMKAEDIVNQLRTWVGGLLEVYGRLSAAMPVMTPVLMQIPIFKTSLDLLSQSATTWSAVPAAAGKGNFDLFTSSIFAAFDPEKNANLPKKLDYMNLFTNNIVTLTKPGNQLDKVAANFDKIQKSMKLTKDHINSMDLKKLTLTDSMMRSLASIAKNPEAMAKAIEGGIDKAFQDLAKALNDLAEKNAKKAEESNASLFEKMQQAMAPSGEKAGGDSKTPQKPGAQKPAAQPAGGGKGGGAPAGSSQMTKDMIAALTAYGAAKNSDRRLKKDIQIIGKSPSGLNIYSFKYINEERFGSDTWQGVMSDEIPRSSVVVDLDGYDMVYYDTLDVEFKQISQ